MSYDKKTGVITFRAGARLHEALKCHVDVFPSCCQARVLHNLVVPDPYWPVASGANVVIVNPEEMLDMDGLLNYTLYAVTTSEQVMQGRVLAALGFKATHSWDACTGSHLTSWVRDCGDQEPPETEDDYYDEGEDDDVY